MSVEALSFVAQIVLCFFFYNSLGLKWLLYLGWAILAVAIILGWRARVAFEMKGESGDKKDWLHTTVVVDSGVYAVVRHPMYLSFILMSLALVLISQHWLNVVFGVILMGLIYNDMRREERDNIKKFGDDYLEYMEKVPRMNLVLGGIRLMRGGRENTKSGA
jgi:protein-S-isoprenylcysteine O-methyltransferase Ste14